MKYQVAVYFDGPRSNWSQKLHASEVTFIGEAPWLWLARAMARSNVGNTGRCAYVITANDQLIEQVNATRTAVE